MFVSRANSQPLTIRAIFLTYDPWMMTLFRIVGEILIQDQNFANNSVKGHQGILRNLISSLREVFYEFLYVHTGKIVPEHQIHDSWWYEISPTISEKGHLRKISVKVIQNSDQGFQKRRI